MPSRGEVPPTKTVRACFHELFGEGSSHTPHDLTTTAHILNEVMRRTLLLRVGYREGLTRIQLWLVSYLVSQTEFDVWDVILSEMEDAIAEGFKGHRQVPFAHWICFILMKAIDRMGLESAAAMRDTPTVFPVYDMCQLMGRGHRNRAARQPRQRPEVSETEAEQDEAIRAVADSELVELEAQ